MNSVSMQMKNQASKLNRLKIDCTGSNGNVLKFQSWTSLYNIFAPKYDPCGN